MSKPDITLQPSKGVIAEAAARIYAAYIAAGLAKDKETNAWIKRSIREAIIIAKTVNASVESHDELAIDESIVVRPNAAVSKSNRSEKKSQTSSKNSRTSKRKSRASTISKPVEKKEALEKLAEEVFLDDSAEDAVLLEVEEDSRKVNKSDAPKQTLPMGTHQPETTEDAASVAEQALQQRR